jgi:hypothetical protein
MVGRNPSRSCRLRGANSWIEIDGDRLQLGPLGSDGEWFVRHLGTVRASQVSQAELEASRSGSAVVKDWTL